MQLGFSGVLFIVFLILKLTKTIVWSWWWVTAPLWIGLLLTIIFVLFVSAAVTKTRAGFGKLTIR